MKETIRNRPTLTVMIQARTPERILELLDRGIDGGADAFGIQLEQLEPAYRTPDTLKMIFSYAKEYPVYVTDYRGGLNGEYFDEALAEELLMAAACGGDLFDVMGDLFDRSTDELTHNARAIQKQKKLIDALHKKGKRVFISSHTYRPMSPEEILLHMRTQAERGADVCKLVSSADSREEELVAFEASARLASVFEKEFLYLCAGSHCRSHRRMSSLIVGGMFLCIAERDALSTAVQPLLSEAKYIIKSMNGEETT